MQGYLFEKSNKRSKSIYVFDEDDNYICTLPQSLVPKIVGEGRFKESYAPAWLIAFLDEPIAYGERHGKEYIQQSICSLIGAKYED